MGKRTGGGGPTTKVKGPPRWWCYYCDTRYDDETKLIQHQRHKHFLCRLCDPKAYGRNCLSLSGLISHVRRSHRQETTEVPGAIEGRRSTEVEVSAMNGIPQAALDAFENFLAEEAIALRQQPANSSAAVVPPESDDEEEEPPPLPKEPDPEEATKLRAQLGIPDLAWISRQLESQRSGTKAAEPEEPQEVKPVQEVKAFDPSLLAARVANMKPSDQKEDEKEEALRREEMSKAFAEEKAKRDAEKARKTISIAFFQKEDLPKPSPAPPVPKVDKSVVADLGFALQANAAQARAAATAQVVSKKPAPDLKTKLLAMQPGGLLKYAVDVGVSKEDIMKANGAKDFIIQLILQQEAEDEWRTFTFKPGKIGVKADWARGEVEVVSQFGQGDLAGVKVGWIFRTIAREKFSKALLQEKIAGSNDYKVVFATSKAALERSRQQGGGRYEVGGARAKVLVPIKQDGDDAKEKECEEPVREEKRQERTGRRFRDKDMEEGDPEAAAGGQRRTGRRRRAREAEEYELEEDAGGHERTGRRARERDSQVYEPEEDVEEPQPRRRRRGRAREEYEFEEDVGGQEQRTGRRGRQRGTQDYEPEEENAGRRFREGRHGRESRALEYEEDEIVPEEEQKNRALEYEVEGDLSGPECEGDAYEAVEAVQDEYEPEAEVREEAQKGRRLRDKRALDYEVAEDAYEPELEDRGRRHKERRTQEGRGRRRVAEAFRQEVEEEEEEEGEKEAEKEAPKADAENVRRRGVRGLLPRDPPAVLS